MECFAGRSLRLDARELDHLAPLLGLIGNELAEIGWRARKRRATQVGKPCLHLGIGKDRIDLRIQFADDLSGDSLGRDDTEPCARFKARHEIAHHWDFWQSLCKSTSVLTSASKQF